MATVPAVPTLERLRQLEELATLSEGADRVAELLAAAHKHVVAAEELAQPSFAGHSTLLDRQGASRFEDGTGFSPGVNEAASRFAEELRHVEAVPLARAAAAAEALAEEIATCRYELESSLLAEAESSDG